MHISVGNAILMNDEQLFEFVRNSYSEVNKEYLQEQISIASEKLTDDQKAELRQKGILT